MRDDGTDVRNLTNSPGEDRMPAWHGSTIAFISDRSRSPQDTFGFSLYTMTDEGKVQTWRAADVRPKCEGRRFGITWAAGAERT